MRNLSEGVKDFLHLKLPLMSKIILVLSYLISTVLVDYVEHTEYLAVHVLRIRLSTSPCSAISITCVSHGDICAVQRTASLLAANLFSTHTAFKIQTTLNVGSSDLYTLGHVGSLYARQPG